MTSPYQVKVAEIVQWLEEYEGPRFHAVLCDPPYALISIAKRFGPGQKEAQEGSDGRFRRLSGGFMGQEWDGFQSMAHYQEWVSTWAELLIEKALHPGAICLFFGGTRTWHRLACGLEDGGFEIYDTFMWVYGQGFPKSHDISKFIDKQAGEEREVVGERPIAYADSDTWSTPTTGKGEIFGSSDGERKASRPVTKPATSDAERWDGYGTATKPAWEPVIVARAPRGDHTYADLALKFGTGALNIDRVRINGGIKQATAGVRTIKDGKGWGVGEGGSSYERGDGAKFTDEGRWPANFGLVHTEFCIKVAEVEGEGRKLNRYSSEEDGGSFAFYAEDEHGEDYDSKETGSEMREIWACVPGCPVRVLDDQAGEQKSGGWPTRRHSSMTRITYGEYAGEVPAPQRGPSEGQVSRFYYCAKASKSERDKGLEAFYWRRVDDGWERIDDPDEYPDDKIMEGNVHPTVKPIEICRYLSKMVLPPDLDEPRRILVPFAGSGSEMIGARQAGWDEVVGVELGGDYADIAMARLRANIGMF